jgi:hypothetical protein
MSKQDPPWLQETRDFCRTSNIKIVGRGPDLLTVEAKSPARAKEIAAQLAPFGLKPVPDEDNAYAGLLDLSKNPAAIQTQKASGDISRRRWDEQILPLLWAVCSLLLIPRLYGDNASTPFWPGFIIGFISLIMFFRDAPRIWGWKLEILPECIQVRRNFHWTTIPWDQIHSVETASAGGRTESVDIKLLTHHSDRLGTFNVAFARRLRDRLRQQLSHRRVVNPFTPPK